MLDLTQASEPPVDARERFAELKNPFGGNRTPVAFSEEQRAILEAAADEIIPGGDGFPAPSEVGIAGFIARYVTPRDQETQQFPNAPEDEFKANVDGLGAAFLAAAGEERIETLRRVEREQQEFFEHLRNLVYFGYYARREVTAAINREIPAGADYRATPQPYGYWDVIEPWDESLLTAVEGSYIRTADARRVDVRTPAEVGSA